MRNKKQREKSKLAKTFNVSSLMDRLAVSRSRRSIYAHAHAHAPSHAVFPSSPRLSVGERRQEEGPHPSDIFMLRPAQRQRSSYIP